MLDLAAVLILDSNWSCDPMLSPIWGFSYCVPADALGRLVQDQNAAVIREIYDENESVMAGFVCHLLVGCKHGCTVAPGR